MNLDLARGMFPSAAGELVATDVRILHAGSGDGLRRLDCLRIGTDVIFEGDIVVRPAMFALETLGSNDVFLGHGVADEDSLWPGGAVPVAVHHSLQDLVGQAMEHWQARTPIRFTQFKGEESFVSFTPGARSQSDVGRVGKKQIVWLRPDATVGTAVHEIGHALGLWHEHSRSDRDQYIVIHSQNMDPVDVAQFSHPIRPALDIGAYDFDSIMHYPSDAFTNNGLPTITTKDGQPIGQRNGLSPGDIATIRKLYPTLHW